MKTFVAYLIIVKLTPVILASSQLTQVPQGFLPLYQAPIVQERFTPGMPLKHFAQVQSRNMRGSNKNEEISANDTYEYLRNDYDERDTSKTNTTTSLVILVIVVVFLIFMCTMLCWKNICKRGSVAAQQTSQELQRNQQNENQQHQRLQSEMALNSFDDSAFYPHATGETQWDDVVRIQSTEQYQVNRAPPLLQLGIAQESGQSQRSQRDFAQQIHRHESPYHSESQRYETLPRHSVNLQFSRRSMSADGIQYRKSVSKLLSMKIFISHFPHKFYTKQILWLSHELSSLINYFQIVLFGSLICNLQEEKQPEENLSEQIMLRHLVYCQQYPKRRYAQVKTEVIRFKDIKNLPRRKQGYWPQKFQRSLFTKYILIKKGVFNK
ncbi:hypothetical protein FGO68_gene17722 [Halteria grandinella]|uniref:Uncharacterized protein n=1 Tax=Halteria grandinella TaxID=5974 RepID=A0A8J8T6X7_HALGN|nr:hypothetical protein FGO68_gene17722 [Halteria grandinella]